MRPQTLMVTAASIVTGLFLAAVGIVLAFQWLDARQAAPNAGARVAQMPAPAPQANFIFEIEAPQPDDFVFNAPMPFAPNQPMALEQAIPPQDIAKARGATVLAKDYRLSGPHTHGNLTVYMIHGPDAIKDLRVMTLQEGVEQNTAVVHDRGQLFIDNRSDRPLFIQSGDIVKGGNQDRTLPYDMLVPPLARNLQVVAMCVEQGRSFPRGNELSSSFAFATEQLPGRSLRMAAYRQNQNDVWNGVRLMQTKLAQGVGSSVKSPQSQSSLQLTLESPRVQQAIQDYLTDLMPAQGDDADVVGFAVAVNGNIHSADVYGSSELFRTLWPKLLRASAVEALAEKQPRAAAAPTTEVVQAFLVDAEKAPAFRQATNRTTLIRHESARSLLFDTCDPANANAELHRSVLAK
jgi:hypothetical protein